MVNLTVKELSVLEKQLVLERNMVKQFKFYSTICSDPQLKQKCEQVSAMHQAHFNQLLNQFQ